jgi:excisionase family DNA binding protein
MENYVGIDRICSLLGVKRQTVYKWIKEKGLPAIRVEEASGAKLKFKESKVREWFEGFTVK